MGLLIPILLGGAVVMALTRAKAIKIGSLSDAPLDLENILKGVERGWYEARVEQLDGWGYVVWLSGRKADGEYTEDIYPISEATYKALVNRGIGKLPKRRIYHELEAAQKAGVDLSGSYDGQLSDKLQDLGRRFNYKGSSASAKPYAQQYFNNLSRAYKAISGTSLPYKESIVYNDLGDEILRYRDYGTDDEKIREAIDELSAGVDDKSVYWRIIGDIATGRCKLLWKTDGVDKRAGKKGLAEWILGRAGSGDRKYYRGVLATKEKGGITPEMYAHRIWESLGDTTRLDDAQIRDILIDAISDTTDPKVAKQMLLDQYYAMHQEQEPDYGYYEQARIFSDDQLQQDSDIPLYDQPF